MGELVSGETSYTIGLQMTMVLHPKLLNRFCTFETKTGPSVRTRLSHATLPNLQKDSSVRFCVFATVFLALSTGVCDATNVSLDTRYVDKKINDLQKYSNMYVRYWDVSSSECWNKHGDEKF